MLCSNMISEEKNIKLIIMVLQKLRSLNQDNNFNVRHSLVTLLLHTINLKVGIVIIQG